MRYARCRDGGEIRPDTLSCHSEARLWLLNNELDQFLEEIVENN